MSNALRHPTALINPGAKIGEGTRIWAFVNIQDGAVIGKNCNVCDNCYVEKGSLIGDHVTLKNGVSIFEGITLEDDVFCGAQVTFINDRFPRSHRQDRWTLEKVLVKKGATIGSNATVMCGITIGSYAVIGAGSVVTRDVPDYTIVAGNPAQFKGYACRCGKKLGEDLRCACGMAYQKKGQALCPQG